MSESRKTDVADLQELHKGFAVNQICSMWKVQAKPDLLPERFAMFVCAAIEWRNLYVKWRQHALLSS